MLVRRVLRNAEGRRVPLPIAHLAFLALSGTVVADSYLPGGQPLFYDNSTSPGVFAAHY
jgi:hypothetical protein